MATIRVQEAPFDLAAEFAALSAASGVSVGGIGCFIGVVRGDPGTEGRRLRALTLQHYPGMTERALGAIAAEAERRFALCGCTVLHRVGTLPVGEGIVLVLAAAPHRGDALAATGFLIDWLKTRAPFWKRQDYDDGSSEWVEARAADEDAAGRWE
jgi:molybdopterin synthase catalytic subunit